MDFLPDVLDHLGKTPREFGGLHVHFEAVLTVDGPRVVARVLYQAAFQPLPGGAWVAFHAATGEGEPADELGAYMVPALTTEVVRVSYPLRVPAGSTHVLAFLEAPPPAKKAARVRPEWRLRDTVEVPTLDPLEGVEGILRPILRRRGQLMDGPESMLAFDSSPAARKSAAPKVHKARELPAGLAQVISIEVTPALDAVVQEVLWREGQPLPLAPPLILPPLAVQVKAEPQRRCRACGFEGSAAEYERARSCPSCDEPWL